jgi:hypothetical protein
MSITGILLNHPSLISDYSVSKDIVPSSYHPKNWNRSAMKGIVYSPKSDSLLYVYGRQGVYVSNDAGKTFNSFMQGDFPKAPRKRRTNSLYLKDSFLLAATNGGLFQFNYTNKHWKECKIDAKDKEILKIVKARDKFIVFSDSHIYASDYAKEISFKEIHPTRDIKENRIRLIDAFIELHDGSIFGLTGKIIWDIMGLILVFLCISAFYIWFYPNKWKKKFKKTGHKQSPEELNRFKFLYHYHKKLGWYTGLILLLICITGIFLRPPLIVSLAGKTIAAKYYPSTESSNVWHKKINNALYDSLNDRFIFECKDGLWVGDINSDKAFVKITIPVRIFAMGATVFEELKEGECLIGSFGGLSKYNLTTGEAHSLMKSRVSTSSGRPASTMISGCIIKSDSVLYALSHYKGLCNMDGKSLKDVYPMPEFIRENYRMPLWNYLFEIHNARIFRSFIGGTYILIIPLLGLLSILVLLSGFIDYLYKRLKR